MLPGAGRCGAQQQQPGDRTGANRSGGEHHTERGGAYRSGAAPEQDCSGTDHSRAAHRQDRSGAHRVSGVKQRSQKREQRLRQRKLQPTRMQKSMNPCGAEQRLDRRGAEHKPAALKRGGSACATGNRSTCVHPPAAEVGNETGVPAFVQGEILPESTTKASPPGVKEQRMRKPGS